MKRPVLLVVIVVNLALLVGLAFIYPHLMVSPGPLVKGHAELATDCFACHTAWRGASSERCITCHAVAEIGLMTTQGLPIAGGTLKGSFHQELIVGDCMACHSDHQGPKLTQRSRKPFSHGLLKPTVRETCATCHVAPKDTVHRALKVECSKCHESMAWRPAHFDHALLAPAELGRCESCHSAPTDRLHRQIQGGCVSCHQSAAWKPATFDHDKHFVLDRDHSASCDTCHRNHDYGQYTCYGCHEHSLAKVRSEHVKEGIASFESCVECHRDPRAEPGGNGGRERGSREKD